MEYIQLKIESPLPEISHLKPFRAVVIVEEEVTEEWQVQVSEWLVKSGCLYMMAWGKECSSWDDSVDMANLKVSGVEDIQEEEFVMTTWHENEPLNEVFWFSKHNAEHPEVEIRNTLILHISSQNKCDELVQGYKSA